MKVKAYEDKHLSVVEKMKQKYPGYETRQRPRNPQKRAALEAIEKKTGKKVGHI